MGGTAVSPPDAPTPDADDSFGASSRKYTTTLLFSASSPFSSTSGTLEVVPNNTLDPSRQRKLHHKTKTGCTNCKKRRVKCDEKIPRCSNCFRRKELCEHRNEEGCLLPNSSGAPLQPPKSTLPSLPHTPSPRAGSAVNLFHMKLFHHFQTCTQNTLVLGPEVWEPAIKLSLDFPSLMHAILCISARHLAFLFPEEAKYASAAAIHLSQTLVLFREDLSRSFNSANVDAFMTTALLLHHDLWTNDDFVSISNKGSMTYDGSKDHIFDLSLGLQQIFMNSMPHAFRRPSFLVPIIRHSPRVVLVNYAHISKCTLANFISYFAYDQPLDRKHLQIPLPFIRCVDMPPEDTFNSQAWPVSHGDEPNPYSHTAMICRLCLLTSFLPEAQPEQGSKELAPHIIHDLARYAFSLPVLGGKTFVNMLKLNHPMALVLMYHFYRAVRIVLPFEKWWWMKERATISEIALKEALEKELSEQSSIKN